MRGPAPLRPLICAVRAAEGPRGKVLRRLLAQRYAASSRFAGLAHGFHHGPVAIPPSATNLDSSRHCLGLFWDRYRQHAMVPYRIHLFAVHRVG